LRCQVVKTVEHDAKVIDHWIDSITALHRTQPPPNVHYSRFCCTVAMQGLYDFWKSWKYTGI